MASVTIPFVFANGGVQNADATQVNSNFTALKNFVETEPIQRDGSIAFTAAQLHPTAPTLGGHITNKTYVDGMAAQAAMSRVKLTRAASMNVAAGGTYQDITWTAEPNDPLGFWAAGTTLTVPANGGGLYAVGMIGISDSAAASAAMKVNGVQQPPFGNVTTTNPLRTKAETLVLAVGDTLVFQWYNGFGAPLNMTNTTLYLVRLSD